MCAAVLQQQALVLPSVIYDKKPRSHFQTCCTVVTFDLFSFPVSGYGCPLIVALTGFQGDVSILLA